MECSCKLWPSPGMYTVTSFWFESRTRAIFRNAEFGFLGVIVRTCRQTPRFCGQRSRTGDLENFRFGRRRLRTSWLIVGIVTYCVWGGLPLGRRTTDHSPRLGETEAATKKWGETLARGAVKVSLLPKMALSPGRSASIWATFSEAPQAFTQPPSPRSACCIFRQPRSEVTGSAGRGASRPLCAGSAAGSNRTLPCRRDEDFAAAATEGVSMPLLPGATPVTGGGSSKAHAR